MKSDDSAQTRSYALVTGGTSGMGLEYVRQLSERGYNVIVAALPAMEKDGKQVGPPSPQVICDLMSAEYPSQDFLPVAMDLARTGAADELCEAISRERPGAEVEVLINNAGVISIKHFREMTRAQVSRELLLHNYTTTMLCHSLLPAMKERGHGYVLNISSLAAWFPFPFISTYSATKSYNRILTNALRTEYYGSGVNIATIYFGAVDTPLFNLKPSLRRLARRLGVMITPEKAARVALRMLFSGRSGRVPGLMNHIGRFVCVLLPRPLVAWIDRKVSKKLGIWS